MYYVYVWKETTDGQQSAVGNTTASTMADVERIIALFKADNENTHINVVKDGRTIYTA